MQVDISEPKSKAFNFFLRFFQLGCQLVFGYWASRYQGVQGCDYTIPNVISILAYAIFLINLVALFVIRCSNLFKRIFFFAVLVVDLLLAAAIIAVMLTKGNNSCAGGIVYKDYAPLQTGIAVLIGAVILGIKLTWEQRYTNAPGNIALPILFLAYLGQWTSKFYIPMLIIGLLSALVSVLTFFIHAATFNKTTTFLRKLLSIGWILGLLILIGLEVLAIVVYSVTGSVSQYQDYHAKKTLAVFIAVNFIDILFWIWGFKTLDIENGDKIRDELFNQNNTAINNPRNTSYDTPAPTNIGTIQYY